MSVKKYWKKPVEVEAMRMPNESTFASQTANGEIAEWIEDHGGEVEDFGSNYIYIETLEGTMTGRPGDFIIKGVQGEFYPIKEAIFRETYEPVGDDS